MKLAQLLGLFLVASSFTAIEGLSFFSRCRIVPDNTTSCLNSTGFSCRNEKYLKVLDSKPFPKKRCIECQAASFYGVTYFENYPSFSWFSSKKQLGALENAILLEKY